MNYSDPESVPPVWEVGDVILDKYEVRQIFTGGGMGLVYRVYHRDWNLDLAVKSPRPQFFQTMQQIENFEQEAETWVNLGLHPHIASCHYVRRLGGIPRLFAEFVEGGTLSDWIRTKKLYEGSNEEVMQRIIDVAIQFAWGLNYAHEKGLVHQDVKPGNVLMSSDGIAKVSDFGLASARRTSTENTTIPTHAGQSILVPGSGFMTPEYASPEQSRGDPLSKMTDVWSWAVSLLEMLLGELTWAKGIAAPAVLEELLEDIENSRITYEIAYLLNSCFGSDSQSGSTRSKSLEYAIEFLLVYYNSRFGPYPRSKPNATETLAVTLNNRAVSLVDLGKTEEAVKLWTRACRSDSSSVDPLYNLSLYKTRTEKGHGKLPKTLKWIDERFNTLDKSVDATLARACILAELGEYKSAQNCIARELEGIVIPDSANALLREFAELGSPSATPSQSFSVPTSGGQYFWVDQCWKTVLRSLYLENSAQGFELLDIKSGSVICRLSHVKFKLSSASVTRDCRYLATLSRDPHFENADMIMVLWDIHSESEIASFTCSSKTATPVITDSGQAIIFSDEQAIWIAVLNIDGFTISKIAQVKYPMRLQLFEDAELLLASGYDSHTSDDQNPETRLISLTSKQTILSRPTTIGMGHPRYCRSRKELICDRLTDIYVFSLEDNVVRFCLSGHRNAINAMSLSPDESLLASASDDGTVRLWDLANRSCRHVYEFSNHKQNVIPVTQVDFSSDGGSLLTANAIGDINVWTIPSTERFYSAPWHISRPMSVSQIVNNYTEFESLWSSASDYFKQEMYFECARKLSQARSLHGKSRDSSAIELWGSLYSKIPKGSLNGFWQISQKSGNNFNPWNLTEIFISETMGYCCCIGRRAGDVRLVSIPELDTILTFSKTEMEPIVIEPLLGDKIGILWGIKPIDWFEANGEFTASSIDIYCLSDESKNCSMDCNQKFTKACFEKTGGHIFFGTEIGEVISYCLSNNRAPRKFSSHSLPIKLLALSASGEYLATGTGNTFSTCDSFLRVWNWNTEQLLGEIRVDSEKDSSLLFSPDSKMLIIEKEKIELWGLPSISLLHEIDASGDVVWCDRDNKRIGVSRSGTNLFDLESKINVMKFAAWTRFSPECRFAVSWEANPGNNSLTCYFLDWDLTS